MWVYFSLSYSELFGNKLNSFPQAESILPVMVTGEGSLLWVLS